MTRAFVDRFAFHVNVFYPSIVEVIQLGPWKGIKNLQGEVCLKRPRLRTRLIKVIIIIADAASSNSP